MYVLNLNNTYQGVELCLIKPYFHKLSIYFQYISIYVLSVLGWKFRRGLRRRVDNVLIAYIPSSYKFGESDTNPYEARTS